jgi:hypothetical protein
MHDAHDEQEHRHEHRQHHEVQREVALERDEAEQLAARHALQAVLAAGERCLQADEVHHLRHRQRDHGEVDALAPDGDGTHHQASAPPTNSPASTPSSGGQPALRTSQPVA